jgi:hypothetical protein
MERPRLFQHGHKGVPMAFGQLGVEEKVEQLAALKCLM